LKSSLKKNRTGRKNRKFLKSDKQKPNNENK
jgi:hypothetical protein